MSDYYTYIFVRSDLPLEQQVIQFGHAACVLGRNLPAHICPKSLNFVGIHARDENHLDDILFHMDRNGVKSHLFIEPDIGNQMTALASEPLTGSARLVFRRFRPFRLTPL